MCDVIKELAKGGRAGCTSTECKKKEVKIGKGELRFGVLVEIKEHQSWVWRHWYVVIVAQCKISCEISLGSLLRLRLCLARGKTWKIECSYPVSSFGAIQ